MSLRKFKTIAAVAGAAILLSGVAACSQEREPEAQDTEGQGEETAAPEDILVGIAMPTRSLERWNKDGSHLQGLLEEAGYETNLQYADNEVDQQISQLQNMINEGADILVIASIDGTALAPILAEAKAQDITVIAYDRLINETPDVDYYATFDNYRVGQLQGEFIRDALDLENADGPFNLEPFAGSPDDNNAKFFFSGAWDVLLPYVKEGKLVVPSAKSPASNDEWQSIGILGWGSEDAQDEMTNRLNSFYAGGTKLDVVLSPNDSLALGIAQALEGAGYVPGEDWPVLTGQDGDQANVLNIIAGKQSMTVWKDTRLLAERVATMIQQIVNGEEVEVNDNETYDNGVKVVPTFLIDPTVVTADNIEDTLIASGFYTAEDLGL
ncbi:MAG: sugar ABC transporter substrate-binding protein [Actinomycetales bacterium]|nr:sugar ABC transporter substrate-binding protein [Actinomycetales bacterium]